VNHDPFLHAIQHAVQGSPTQAHNLRFFHAWELLTRLGVDNYRFCIMTDVRDVIFQTNPSTWLENSGLRQNRFIAPSEGIIYENEDWGRTNMIHGHGDVMWEMTMHDKLIYNVGTIAGDVDFMRRLFYMIYSMTGGRHYPSDQSSFNILCHDLLKEHCVSTLMKKGWAAQIGTTWDHTKSWLWQHLVEPKPIIRGDGVVLTDDGEEFCIVHQWDRNDTLKRIALAKYV
jgi:hypothetical protein